MFPCPICNDGRGELEAKCKNCGWDPNAPVSSGAKSGGDRRRTSSEKPYQSQRWLRVLVILEAVICIVGWTLLAISIVWGKDVAEEIEMSRPNSGLPSASGCLMIFPILLGFGSFIIISIAALMSLIVYVVALNVSNNKRLKVVALVILLASAPVPLFALFQALAIGIQNL